MVSFGVKAKIKKAGNLNQGCSYVITTAMSFKLALWLAAFFWGLTLV